MDYEHLMGKMTESVCIYALSHCQLMVFLTD